ncbi:MAG TPA: hypothetical protein VL282_17775, partial [Tepidisphaeraceae bacterium]|nr:hypothetical protein [Tepidisphaeraceae bacterium]
MTSTVDPPRHLFVRYLLTALIIAPGAWIALLVYLYGVNIPYWDEWDNTVQLHMKYIDGTLRPSDFFSYTNEHRPAVPRAIDLAIEILTRGNRRVEMFASILAAAVSVWCIYLLARRTIAQHALALTAAASWLLFSTMQYENWLWGQQLMLILPITFFFLGLAVTYTGWPFWAKVTLAVLLGIGAILCNAAGFFICALLGCVQLVHTRSKRLTFLVALLVWVTAFSVSVRLYSLSSPATESEPMTRA